MHVAETFPAEPASGLFSRLAELGHFVELTIKFSKHIVFESPGMPACVLQALIDVTRANPNLEILALNEDIKMRGRDWSASIGTLLRGLKDHPTLHTLKMNVPDCAFGHDYADLRQLLKENRNIAVTKWRGKYLHRRVSD